MSNYLQFGLIFGAGILVGGLVAIVWFTGSFSAPVAWSEGSATTTAGLTLPPDTTGTVAVADQAAGESVLVDFVTAAAPGVWVAVREVLGVELGNVLGAARTRGPIVRLEISLLRATTPMHSYAVVLYRDDGDDAFDHEKDSVYVDFETGKPVVAPFSTTP